MGTKGGSAPDAAAAIRIRRGARARHTRSKTFSLWLAKRDEELAKARETAQYAGEADPYKHPEETAEDPESDGWDDDDDWDDDDEA